MFITPERIEELICEELGFTMGLDCRDEDQAQLALDSEHLVEILESFLPTGGNTEDIQKVIDAEIGKNVFLITA